VLIVAIVLIVLFGSKKLPDAARWFFLQIFSSQEEAGSGYLLTSLLGVSPGLEGIDRVKRELSPGAGELGGQPAECLIAGTGVVVRAHCHFPREAGQPGDRSGVAGGHLR